MNKTPEKLSSIPFTPTTINQMELEACNQALQYIQTNGKKLKINHAVIYTDSQYVAEGQHRCDKWNHDNWVNRHGVPIKNVATWKSFMRELRKARQICKVEISKIEGKSIAETLEVDTLAKQSSAKDGGSRFPERQRIRVIRTLGTDKRSPIKYPATGQRIIARIYSDMSAGKLWEFRFQEIEPPTNEPSRKYLAFTDQKLSHKIHRGHYYSILFNEDENLPFALELGEIEKPIP